MQPMQSSIAVVNHKPKAGETVPHCLTAVLGPEAVHALSLARGELLVASAGNPC